MKSIVAARPSWVLSGRSGSKSRSDGLVSPVNGTATIQADPGSRAESPGLSACVIAIANQAKKLLSVPGTGQRWSDDKSRPEASTVYGFSPSSSGRAAPETVRQAAGQCGVRGSGRDGGHQSDGPGTNVKYGRVLEGGAEEMRNKAWGKPTKPYRWRLLARPWLRRALTEMTPFIRAVMARPMKF